MSFTALEAFVILGLLWAAQCSASPDPILQGRAAASTCAEIAASVSSASDVFFPGAINYDTDISHWASSSSQLSACSVEPGTASDVGIILQILGSTRTAFAVKGGGHTSNAGFSSTSGVQIAMSRFSEVTYNDTAGTADIGAGLVWDDVYDTLVPLGVNVVGGRVTGVGVAGFTLGGGYSWKTNQYGLTIDTVQAFELVLPNGTVTSVSATSNSDLFFGLKGGGNNFGIVTKFTLTTFPQTDVWGGLITITGNNIPAVNAATAKFAATVTDPKAAIITTYNFVLGEPGVSQLLFYDAPSPPAGIFDDFLAIPFFTKDVETRTFTSLVQSSPSNATSGSRGSFNTVSLLNYSANMLNVIVNQTTFWGQASILDTGVFISYDVEPFLPSLFSHGAASAYPPDRSRGLLPQNLYFAWLLPTSDAFFQDALRESASVILDAAIAEGQDVADAAVYGNYALFDTPLSGIYGSNVARLESIQAQYDPADVMGLAGGFKL